MPEFRRKKRVQAYLLEFLPAGKIPPSGLWSSESAAPRAWMDGLCQPYGVTETGLWACQFYVRKHDAHFVFSCFVHLRHALKAGLTQALVTLIWLFASVCGI